jgi:hypothetical protein
MTLRYPWSHLGIEPTDDQKAIRKAYAVKLRETRPDEDPAGFQALLEARDHALNESRYLQIRGVSVQDEPPQEIDERPAAPDDLDPVVTVVVQAPPAPLLHEAESSAGVVEIALDSPADVEEEEDETDIEQFLDEVGTPHPWHTLQSQWSRVFDALERAPFEDYFYLTHRVLDQLIEAIRRQVGVIPDIPNWQPVMQASEQGPLGPYAEILRDLESRFQYLKQDTILLEYLDEDKARDMTNALTVAVGRAPNSQSISRPIVNVEEINMSFVDAAFAGEPKMRDYYTAARKTDRFPRAFSIVALLFPLPTALYYRLYGVAALLGVLMALNTAFSTLDPPALYASYAPISIWVYIVVSIALALNWRRLRITGMARKIQNLKDKGLDPLEIKQRLAEWGRPSRGWMCVGIALLVLVFVVRIYARYGQS